jgi:hypothetical protein
MSVKNNLTSIKEKIEALNSIAPNFSSCLKE